MTPVWEDPNELGYWSSAGSDRGDANVPPWLRAFNFEIENMTLPEFFPPGYTQKVCDSLLDEQDQRIIQECAIMMHAGQDRVAEHHRALARYDYSYRRADRTHRGLPVGRL